MVNMKDGSMENSFQNTLEVLMYHHIATEQVEIDDRILNDGDEYWLDDDGHLHRDNGPAVTRTDGVSVWYKHGFMHREDGPAMIRQDGAFNWLKDGKLHREDGPAIFRPGQCKKWYLNGSRHREDGPAIEYYTENGVRTEWWKHGVRYPDPSSDLRKF